MASLERKRCSNIAPVRRLRSLAWMKARKLPGVRCSTLNTECKSLLCLITMPGRNCVAGIAIPITPWFFGGATVAKAHGSKGKNLILHARQYDWEMRDCSTTRQRLPDRSFLTWKRIATRGVRQKGTGDI